ncbi:hypothetical protein [Winogradskyella luteola]|uniref:DUF4369 domain-containing protein n=1 Tax=Winogradskyella luteola TaxID=2828330 RepID=A0A9X1JQH0_9FLAO|nr:hypothetical protein [Winogradskyella luteola]MBV7269829.1 hypothetical protein [Winogradskyella luteola]
MKKFLSVILLMLSFSLFADAGYAYRFHLNLQSEKGETINGYFYLYTYKKFNNEFDASFKNFVVKDEIALYSHIVTINIGSTILDFTNNDFKTQIKLKDYLRIRINEFVDFGNTDRLFELSPEKFKIIKTTKPKSTSIYNEKYAENCSLILITWNDDSDLLEHRAEISEKIKSFEEDFTKYNNELNAYFQGKKKELLKKGILFIFHCDAL